MSADRVEKAIEAVADARREAARLTTAARDELRAAVWEVVENGWSQTEVARFISDLTGVEWSRQRVWALMHEADEEES